MEKIEFKEYKTNSKVVEVVQHGERDKCKLTFIMDLENFELSLKESYELLKFLKKVLP